MLERPKLIQVGETDWLLLDVYAEPTYLIHYGAAVHQVTHETLMRYRVDRFNVCRQDRWPIGFYETLAEAEAAAVVEVLKPPPVPRGTVRYPGG